MGCFPLLWLSLMPPCSCNPSKSRALMHRLPYFSTKMTVACREGCALCVCVRARALCHFWTSPCVLSAPALGLRKPPGSISSAANPHSPESCFVWKHVCFVSSHHKEDKLPLLSPRPILTGCVWPRTHQNGSSMGCCWLQQKSAPSLPQTETFQRADPVSPSVHSVCSVIRRWVFI